MQPAPHGHVVAAVIDDEGNVRPRQDGDIEAPRGSSEHVPERGVPMAVATPVANELEQIEAARGDQPVHLARARLVDRIVAFSVVLDRLEARANPVLTPPPPSDPGEAGATPAPVVGDLAHNLDHDGAQLGHLVARLDRIVDRLEV